MVAGLASRNLATFVAFCSALREKDSRFFQIVCNSFAKGEWGKEERKSNPYKKGDDIDIRVRAHDSKFQIFVDQVSPFENEIFVGAECSVGMQERKCREVAVVCNKNAADGNKSRTTVLV